MARRGTLFEMIKSKNPDLADSISKAAKTAKNFGFARKTGISVPAPKKAEPIRALGSSPPAQFEHKKDISVPKGAPVANPQVPFNTAKRVIDCHIGLDFGTSCTKVVVRLPDQKQVFPVPFGKFGHHSNPYLLPNAIWCSPDQKFSLSASGGATRLADLKMSLLRLSRPVENSGDAAKDSVFFEIGSAAYLAEAIKWTKDWFQSEFGHIYSKEQIRWWCNVGVPAKSYADEEICRRFGRVALTAWAIAEGNVAAEAETIGGAILKEGSWRATVDLESDSRIQIVPEVLATVGSYVKSNARKDGPHILMDVGAGTLDMCSFRFLERQGDPRCVILSANVALLGVLELERRRVQVFLESAKQHVESHEFSEDPVVPIRSDPEDYLPSGAQLEEIKNALFAAEVRFENECGGDVGDIWKAIKNKKDPNYKGEIPLLLSGGGSEVPVYKRLIENIAFRMRETISFGRLRETSLNTLDGLPSEIPADQLQRHSVATGLSYPRLDLGEILRPQDIVDIPKATGRGGQPDFVSKDQV